MPKSALDKVVTDALKKYDLKVGALDDIATPVEAISTGNWAIDAVTGIGGLPRGRLVELYGLPSSGKTTTALQTAVMAQRAGLVVLYMDYEHALDPAYATALGLETGAGHGFYLAQPDSLEQGQDVARKFIATGEVGLVIIDSLAAMTPRAVLAAEAGDSLPALRARLLATFWEQIVADASRTSTCVVALNHLKDVFDISPMGKRLASQGVKRITTPGGTSLKFYASLRLEYAIVGHHRAERDNMISGEAERANLAAQVKVTAVKNKLASPYRSAEVRATFGKGFSETWSALQALVGRGVVKKAGGGHYKIPADLPTPTARPGEAALLEALDRDPAARAAWIARAMVVVSDSATASLEENPPEEELADALSELEEAGAS